MKGKCGSGLPLWETWAWFLHFLRIWPEVGAQDKLPFPFIMHEMDLGCQEYTKDLITYQQAPIIPILWGKKSLFNFVTVLTIHIDCKKRIIKNVVYFIKVILAVRSRFWAGWIHEFTTASQTAYGNLLGGTFWHCQVSIRGLAGCCELMNSPCSESNMYCQYYFYIKYYVLKWESF